MKPLEEKKARHILRVALLTKNAKSLLQAIALHLRLQRKSLITLSVKICKMSYEWFGIFFRLKRSEAAILNDDLSAHHLFKR